MQSSSATPVQLDEIISSKGSALTLQYNVSRVANTLILLASIVGLVGITLHVPVLYYWHLHGIPFHLVPALALVVISAGYLLLLSPEWLRKKKLIMPLALLCFLIPILTVGIIDMRALAFGDGHANVDVFLGTMSSTSIKRSIPLYADIGVLLGSITSFIYFSVLYVRERCSPLFLQIPGIVLTSLAAFGFLENIADVPIYQYLISMPASFCLFMFGIAMTFFPTSEPMLVHPFASASRRTRFYTLILCLGWSGAVLWQTLGLSGFFMEGVGTDSLHTIRHMVIIDDLFEVIFSSFLLILGLHIVTKLEITTELAAKLHKAFNNYALLAATLSHDLKTPIHTQMNTIEMIQQGYFGDSISQERVQKMLKAIYENNQFELELILNLVDLLRYEIKQERFNPQPLEINHLLNEVCDELAPLAARKGQELQVHPCPVNDQLLIADVTGVKRVLQNLVGNAIKHIGRGFKIEISVQPLDNTFRFCVQDNGPGISARMQQTLFQRQASISGQDDTLPLTTSGLGLYIAKQIIHRHGGEIRVESSPGGGSAFYFTLPRRQPMANEQPGYAMNILSRANIPLSRGVEEKTPSCH